MDETVPHHARLTPLNFHAEYEGFVGANKASAAVADNGTYGFNGTLAGHYENASDPWDWVDYNAHTSYDWFAVASTGDPADFAAAMAVLLPIAQRTTAGFLLMFLRTVNAPPTVQIVGPTAATVGAPFSLAAIVSEDVAVSSILWTKASGGGDTGREGMFEFATPGTHAVRVEVTDVLGLTANATHAVSLRYPEGPRAVVSGPTAVASGDAATFDGSGSAPDVVRYEWTVDGRPAGSGATTAAWFEGSRVGLVELRVWDSQGRDDSVLYPVAVEDRVPPAVDLPERLAAAPSRALTLAAHRYVNGDFARSVWYVDGDAREAANVSVRFPEPGVHVVALVAFDAAGNLAVDSAAVVVEAESFPLWIPALAIVAATASLVALFLRRKRGQG